MPECQECGAEATCGCMKCGGESMKKCDVKGCRNKAEVFGKTLAFCREHWSEVTDRSMCEKLLTVGELFEKWREAYKEAYGHYPRVKVIE